jgi:nuclear cap-binding protein subunit 1
VPLLTRFQENPYHDVALEFINRLRSKATTDEIKSFIADFRSSLQIPESEADDITLDLAAQCILLIGSRSFSHFLNVQER